VSGKKRKLRPIYTPVITAPEFSGAIKEVSPILFETVKKKEDVYLKNLIGFN
jgi:hypothetical protein